jgi:hypothetical protein
MQVAGQAFDDRRLQDWARAGGDFRERLNAESEEHVGLITFNADMRRLSVYGRFLEPIRTTLNEGDTEGIQAAFGRVIVACASGAVSVPPALITGFFTLLRSGDPRDGRHPEWKELAEDFPATAEQIKRWVERATVPAIQRFLIGLEESRAISIVDQAELMRPPPKGGADERNRSWPRLSGWRGWRYWRWQ